MKNLRYKYVVLSSPLFVAWAIPWANHLIRHPEKYDDKRLYKHALTIIRHMANRAHAKTICYGKENLPQNGGYVLYSNHQGKYDALGIFLTFPDMCGVLWEEKSASRILARQVNALVKGKTINFTDYKGQIRTLNKIAEEVSNGRKYLVFPEGGYKDNKNNLQEFKSGCFIASVKSKTPIVPVAIYDSWRAMDSNSFNKVTTQVHFLEPIVYEDYKSLKKNEISDLVKKRIEEKMDMLKKADPCNKK